MSRRLHLTTMGAAFALMFAVVLGGCASTPTGGARGGAFCDVARPLTPSTNDVDKVSLGLARQVVSHNRYGEQSCGWKP